MVETSLPLYYFGPINYWIEISQREKFIYNTQAFIPKSNFYNRTNILTAQGVQTLSIPLVGGRGQKIPMNEIKISYAEPWHKKHLSALKTAYSKSPYFEFYQDEITSILNSNRERLLDLNLLIYQFLTAKLKLNIPLEENSKLNLMEFNPKMTCHLTPYPQVFRDRIEFQPNLSILDVLFNLGPETGLYLKKNEY